MTSLYDQSIPVLIQGLRNLSAMLKQGSDYCAAHDIDPTTLLESSLTKDMRPLTYSARFCCSASKWTAHRVGGHENIVFADDETTFDQLQARIASNIQLLESVDPKGFEGKENEPVTMRTPYGNFQFKGQDYVSGYALATFYFHLTTVYWILNHGGVDVGPFDYIGPIYTKVD